ncbi:unnamed protein product [Brachionus calyciflorus]|uniref:Rho guanine nucleotide exchange factor 2 n=1 Tax=Brachionus calyciflorus TaxID=104777 RepID=A0A813S9I5_9BILA|nr:unnamed protein product [Brachionus calyciflorus]
MSLTTSSPKTKPKLCQKYSAISALITMPPLPNNLHHNPHHNPHHNHHHNHHHHHSHHNTNLSIFDIKHFSSNLSTADPNEILDNSQIELSKKSILNDRPISTEDVIIVDEDDNHVVLPIKNLNRPTLGDMKQKTLLLKLSNENLYSKIKSSELNDASLSTVSCSNNTQNINNLKSTSSTTNPVIKSTLKQSNSNQSTKPSNLNHLRKPRNNSTSSTPDESKRSQKSQKPEIMCKPERAKLDISDPTNNKPKQQLTRSRTRLIRKQNISMENKEEIYYQINDDYEDSNSIYEEIESDLTDVEDEEISEEENLDTNQYDDESDESIDLSCFDTVKENKKFDDGDLNLNDSRMSSSTTKHETKTKSKIAKLFNTFSNSLQSDSQSALLPPLPRHNLLPQSITVAPLTDFDRNLNTRRSKRFTRPTNLVIQEISLSTHNSPSNSSSCSPVNTITPSVMTNLQKAASTPSIFDKLKTNETRKNDENEEKLASFLHVNNLNLASSASLNTADFNANKINKINSLSDGKNLKSNKRSDYSIKLSLQKTDTTTTSSTPSPPSLSDQISPITNEVFLSNTIPIKPSVPIGTTSSKDLLTVNEFLKEIDMKKNENSQLEEGTYLVPVGTSTATNSKSSLITQVTTDPITAITSPVHRSPNSSYDQIIMQQSTPLKNQLESHAKALSKSKKLGNILKLASVRGAKSKSIKHKYSTQFQQHAFIVKTVNSDFTCDICQKTLLNKKALVCKNCQINVHDTQCKDQVSPCLHFKKSIFSQSKSQNTSLNMSTSTSSTFKMPLPVETLFETKKDNNLIELSTSVTTASNGCIIGGLNSNNNSIKTISNNRPRSMDISKYFQAHLSKSTSNMYSKSINEESPDYEAIKSLRESVDSLNYKAENEQNLNASNSTSSIINSINNQNTVSSTGSVSSNGSTSLISGCLYSNLKLYLSELNKEFSSFELEFSATNWADLQNDEYLQTLSRNARNKQENIFEFVKTEVNYFKILSMCQRLFMSILVNDCRVEQKLVDQIFPDLEKLMELHKSLLDELIDRYKISKNKFIESIGDILYKILSEKSESWVSVYSKICCTHINAKLLFKQLITSNKLVALFSNEISKHALLKRYHIPDCLTIITQRLTKYLTLIENILTNSRDNSVEIDVLNKSLDKLRSILTQVNDSVAFYQNLNEFKKYLDNFDQKSYTKSFVKIDQQIKERNFTKTDLTGKPERKIISLNQVNVKVMSKNGKEYKNVTCVTMNDMIVFLQMNEKSSKFLFMNETSVIPCSNGILIRPKVSDLNQLQTQSFTQIHHSRTISQSNSIRLDQNNSNQNPSNNSNVSRPQTLESTKMLITYIVHTITNEIIEIKFPDETSRNQWLVLVHTHITPFIEENVKEDVEIKTPVTPAEPEVVKLSPEMANLVLSFNNLITNQIHSVNLMRSASSAGETITKTGQDTQLSIPKRAETFNGASSSKESQMSIININSDLFQKPKVFVNNRNSETLSTTESDYSTTTNRSGDSGYQSKSCCIYADLDQSVNLCNCLDESNGRKFINDENNVQTIDRNNFELMLRNILNDYQKTKRENFELKKMMDNKDKSIDLLKKALDEYRVQLDQEKQDLEKKYCEIEKKEILDASTNNTANTTTTTITRLNNNISNNTTQINNSINSSIQSSLINNQTNNSLMSDINNNQSNKVSILVKCERTLLTSSSQVQVKKDDQANNCKNGSNSSILFL